MGLMDKFKKDEKKVEEELRPNMNEVSEQPVDDIAEMEKALADKRQVLEQQREAKRKVELEALEKAEIEKQALQKAKAIEDKQKVSETVQHEQMHAQQGFGGGNEAIVDQLQSEFERVVLAIRPLEEHAVVIEELMAKYGVKPQMPQD